MAPHRTAAAEGDVLANIEHVIATDRDDTCTAARRPSRPTRQRQCGDWQRRGRHD
jgi:hypothetical protein